MSAPEPKDSGESAAPGKNPFADRGNEPPAPLSLSAMPLPWAVGVLALLLCGIVNVAAIPFGENLSGPPGDLGLFFMALGLGIIGGQIGGLSTILVWSRGPFVVRCVLIWLVGLGLYACWFIGLWLMNLTERWQFGFYLGFAQAVAASLPLLSLAVQLPQWLARFYFGWRIDEPGTGAGAVPTALSIRDLLVGTAVTALTITAVRFSQDADDMTTAIWIGWAIAVGIITIISALVMLPLLVLIFRFPAGWALLYILTGSPLLAGLTMYVIVAINGRSGGPDARDVAGFLLAATSCVAATSVPLWLAKWSGYRLKFNGEV